MEKVKLGECATYINGYAFKPSDWKKEGIPIIRIQNLTGTTNNPNYYQGEIDEKYLVQNGDVLISWSGSLGIYQWNRGKAYLNQHIFKVKFDKRKIDKKYFTYLVKSKIADMLKNTHGSTMKHITKANFDKIEINLHDIEEQTKIANNLEKLQEIICARKNQINELDKLIKSQFVEMFGDPISNSKNISIKKLGDICKIYRGASPRPINKYLNGTIPWIKIGDATNGDSIYLNDTKEKVTEEGAKKSRLIKKGSLIFANCGVSLGFARIINFDGCIHDGWLAFENFENVLNPIFLLQSLNFCTDHFRKIAPDGTQPNLNTGIMKEYEQIVPNIDEQNKYVDFIKQIDKQKFVLQKSYISMMK